MPRKKTYTVVAEFTDHHTGTDLDRLSREPAYQAIIEMELASSGVNVDYVLGQYADSAEGDLTKMIKSAISK